MLSRTDTLSALSLAAQVMTDLSDSDVTALCDMCGGHAEMTDHIAKIVLMVIEAGIKDCGSLDKFWLSIDGVPIYEVSQNIAAHCLNAPEFIVTSAMLLTRGTAK